MLQLLAILLLLLFIFASAIFSGSEMALFSLPRAEILSFKDSSNHSERCIYQMMYKYDRILTTIILGNMFVNSCISMLNDELLSELSLPESVLAVISALTGVLILLFFGEITPMTIAYANARSWAMKIAVPLFWFQRIISPITNAVSYVSNKCLDLLGRTSPKPLNYKEYNAYIDSCVEDGVFSAKHVVVLKEIFDLQRITLGSVMRARVDLVCLSDTDSPDVVADKIQRSGQAFMPVSKSGIDNSYALLNVLDFFRLSVEDRKDWMNSKAILRNLPCLPAQTSLNKAYSLMRSHNVSAAFVIDEYGGLSGLISIQDIYAEVVGQSVEFSENGAFTCTQDSENLWTFDGSCSLDFVRENCTWKDCNADGAYRATTLNGLFCEEFGMLPENGETVQIGNYELKAIAVLHQRIDKIQVRQLSDDAVDGDDNPSEKSRGEGTPL